MIYTRTPISMDLPVQLDDVKAHLRVTHDFEDPQIATMTETVAMEFEQQCEIALLSQIIIATTRNVPGCTIELPVGPVLDGATATVAALGNDGTVTAQATGFWLEAGRYPVLHMDAAPTTRLRVTYIAGFVESAPDLPADVRQAIAEQAARLYEQRGGIEDKGPALSPHSARVIARYRRVRL